MKRLLITLLLVISSVSAADAPKILDSIRADLRTLQLQISNGNVEILRIQQQQAQLQNQFVSMFNNALKDSKIDPDKYELDPNTLSVKEKAKK